MVLIAENYALLYNRKGAYQTFEKCVYSCDPFLWNYAEISFINTLSANPTKWPNTLTRLFECVRPFCEIGA